MKNTGKKIGLFGGTFDPVHMGHLIIADSVYEVKGLDTIIFIPSAYPPHKSSDIMFNARKRFNMLSLAVKDNPRFVVSDIELKRKGLSYTIDTLRKMKATLPDDTDLSFIVGMDNLFEISTWKAPRDILNECSILVAERRCDMHREIPGWLKDRVEMISAPAIEISSTDIRRRIREGKSIRYLVPDIVVKEIEKILEVKSI